MPTEKPRVTITISQEELQQIDDFRFNHKMKNQTQAILALVRAGFEELGIYPKKITPSYSGEARQLGEIYDRLDRWGQRLVWNTAQHEFARTQDETRFIDRVEEEKPKKVIPLFLSAPAAGLAAPIMGEDYDEYTMQENDPQGALFAVRVSGDSMEPYFRDGSIVFCNKDPMRGGDIGVFSVDGDSVIKQYYRDPLGMVYLFSLNRARSDADVVITRDSGRSLVCLGRVITNRRFDLPL